MNDTKNDTKKESRPGQGAALKNDTDHEYSQPADQAGPLFCTSKSTETRDVETVRIDATPKAKPVRSSLHTRIAAYLDAGHSLTGLEALDMFQTIDLAGAIHKANKAAGRKLYVGIYVTTATGKSVKRYSRVAL